MNRSCGCREFSGKKHEVWRTGGARGRECPGDGTVHQRTEGPVALPAPHDSGCAGCARARVVRGVGGGGGAHARSPTKPMG